MNDLTRQFLSWRVFLSPGKDAFRNINQLVLVTGESGSGKTRWCQELVQQARLEGISPLGVISPAVFVDNNKVGIDLLEIHTGERRHLAYRRSDAKTNGSCGPHTGDWQFDAEVLNWANQILDNPGTGNLLILDELGPLEFLENQGFINGLKLVDEQRYHVACVTVRPLLLATAQDRWPWSVVLDISKSTSDLQGSAP
jgi:nucleoside-triphosphatase THEP1